MAERDESEDVKKHLEFTETEEKEQPLNVYLRIKPSEREPDHRCVSIISETSVEARAPSTSVAFRNNTRRRRPATYKFSFSQVLSPSSSQGDVFQATTCHLLEKLVNDSTSSLIFSFGVTNSGKTFTIEGTQQESGILPRSLDYVFNSIHMQLNDEVKVRPDKYSDIIELDEQKSVVEKTMLDELCRSSLSINCKTPSRTPAKSAESTFSTDLTSNCFTELVEALQLRRRDSNVFEVLNGEAEFVIYVSYLEIYNECVFDLLEASPHKRKQRRALPLSEDKSGNVYIKFLRKVHVGSADDALRAVALGKRNRQMAATLFNEESSRSHCIFTIYLIRMTNGKNTMSQMSFVDLAGSERMAKRTVDNTRLKESGNINKSLMTLKSCIATVRYNNTHRTNPRIIPYRESKLTRLLQNYFVNRRSISMIVNISLDPSAFDETLHVLRFSAIASQVRIPAAVTDDTELSNSLEEDDDDDEEFEILVQEIENLREENFMLKRDIRQKYIDMQFQELHIRETIVAENMKKFLEIDKFYQESLDTERDQLEEAEQRRMSLLGRMMTESHQSELLALNTEVDQLKQQLQASNSEVVCEQQMLPAEQLAAKGEEVQKLMDHMADFEDELRDLQLLLNEKDSKLDDLMEENSQLRTSLEDANRQVTAGAIELKEVEKKLSESEEKMSGALRDANAKIKEMEKDIRQIKKNTRKEKKDAEEIWRSKIKDTEDTIERLQTDIKRMESEQQQVLCKMKNDKEHAEEIWRSKMKEKEGRAEDEEQQQQVLYETTTNEEADHRDPTCSILVNDVETSVHTEVDVTPKAARKKRRGRKRKSEENKAPVQNSKKRKCEQMTEYGSTVTRSPRRAKLKAIEQLAIIETTTPPAKTVKKSTRSKVGQLLDAVLTPLTTRVRIVLSPAPSEKASSDQSSPNAREDPSHQTKKKKQTRGLFSKSQISWPVAFQGTTNKTIQGPSDRLLRSTGRVSKK